MSCVLRLVVQLDSKLDYIAIANQRRQYKPGCASARLLMAGCRPSFAVVDLGVDGVADGEGTVALLNVRKGVNDRNLDPSPTRKRVGRFYRDLRQHNIPIV